MRTRVIVILSLVALAAIGGNFIWQAKMEREDPVVFRKNGLNEPVFPGMTIRELTLHFGEPDRKAEENGSTWYYFDKAKLIEAPVNVRVDEKTGLVLEFKYPDPKHD